MARLPTRPGMEWLPPPRWPPRQSWPSKAWPWWLPTGDARRAGPGREIPQTSLAALSKGSTAPDITLASVITVQTSERKPGNAQKAQCL